MTIEYSSSHVFCEPHPSLTFPHIKWFPVHFLTVTLFSFRYCPPPPIDQLLLSLSLSLSNFLTLVKHHRSCFCFYFFCWVARGNGVESRDTANAGNAWWSHEFSSDGTCTLVEWASSVKCRFRGVIGVNCFTVWKRKYNSHWRPYYAARTF